MFWEKVTRTINAFLLTASILLNFCFLIVIFHIYQDLNARMVFDIDTIRRQYVIDSRYFYHKGCVQGSDYPDDLKEASKHGEYQSSASYWCTEQTTSNEIEGEAVDNLKGFGKEFKYRGY